MELTVLLVISEGFTSYFRGFHEVLVPVREAMNAKDFASMEIERDPFAWGFTNVTFKDLAFEIPDKDDSGNRTSKTIVAPCSGHLSTGSLTAIMGEMCEVTLQLLILWWLI